MRRAASERLGRVLAVLFAGLLTLSAPAQQPSTLPSGFQGSATLSGAQRDQLRSFIEANYQTMETGSINQQRGARDQLLGMFDAPSVSTAFRQAAGEVLSPRLVQSIDGSNRWNRFAAFRIAARLASEDSARIFEEALDPGSSRDQSDVLMALGQLRVMFLEVEVGGLAVSDGTLRRLSTLVSRSLTETDDTDRAFQEARALRALATVNRSELAGVRDHAAAGLATAVAARLAAAGTQAIGSEPKDLDALLVPLETLDAVRNYLVVRQGGARLDPAVSKAFAQLAGQSVAFVTRNYEQTRPEADDARRYLQRMVSRGADIATNLVGDHNAHTSNNVVAPNGMPRGDDLAKWLAARDMRTYRLAAITIVNALRQMHGFAEDWAQMQ